MRAKRTSISGRIQELTKWVARLDIACASITEEVADLRTLLAAGSPATSTTARPGSVEAAIDGDSLVNVAVWVEWLVNSYRLGDRFPECWYLHDGLVEVLCAMQRWHSTLKRDQRGDPSHLVLWVDALYRLDDRLFARITQRCLSSHDKVSPWKGPTIDELNAVRHD
jgi:hypothetical protein